MTYRFFLDLMKRNRKYPVYAQKEVNPLTSLLMPWETANGEILLENETDTLLISAHRTIATLLFPTFLDSVYVSIEVMTDVGWKRVCFSRGRVNASFKALDKYPKLKEMIQNSYDSINQETLEAKRNKTRKQVEQHREETEETLSKRYS